MSRHSRFPFRAAPVVAALALALSAESVPAYFLSLHQKGGLLADGVIRDTAGNVYNVRIVPGYGRSAEFARGNWRAGARHEKRGATRIGEGLLDVPRSLRHAGDYATAAPYAGMAEGLRESWTAEKYLYGTFMGSGLAGAWEEYWGNAARAHRRKSFGWWLAYPWATGKGALNSTLRVGTGVSASAFVAAYGLVGRPVFEVAKPPALVAADATVGVAKVAWGAGEVAWGAAGNQVGGAVVLPAVTAAWNTAVGVPLAVAGKAPTPGSVDGWWISMLPGSPDYDQGLDDRSKLRLESLDPVLDYETASFRYMRARDSLRALRQVALDSLEREKARIGERYLLLEREEEARLLSGLPRPVDPSWRKLDARETEYVVGLLRERLAGRPEYEALDEAARGKLLEDVAQEWGGNILATPREALGPYRKTGPHTLLGDEAREVFE